MLKREIIAALADLRDDEQIRVKVGEDYYLPVAVSIEPFGTLTSPEGDAMVTRPVNNGVIYIREDDKPVPAAGLHIVCAGG